MLLSAQMRAPARALTWKWLVKSHKQDALKRWKRKGTLTGTGRKQGYGDVVCISIFKCISGLYTKRFHNAESCVCNGAAVKLQWVRAEKNAEVATVTSWLVCLCFIKMSLISLHWGIISSWKHSCFPPIQFFLLSGLSWCLFTGFQLFLVPCTYICIFILFFLPFPVSCFFFFCKLKKKQKTGCFNVPGCSLFTQTQNTWIIFIHFPTGLWMTLLGASGAKCAFQFCADDRWETPLCCLFFLPLLSNRWAWTEFSWKWFGRGGVIIKPIHCQLTWDKWSDTNKENPTHLPSAPNRGSEAH